VRRPALIFLIPALAGCGALPQPFSKEQPLSIRDPLVAPPWQAMLKAGPNASKEIDLETLNGPSYAAQTPAAETPPEAEPEAQPQKPDNRVAITSVAVIDGEGNRELTKAMRKTLSGAGWKVRSAAAKDALSVKLKVIMGEPRGNKQAVTLSWSVLTPAGKSLGTITQTNDVPSGSLDEGWGENAKPAAEAAATGIFDLIGRYR
jgi:hypothetical protein